MFFQFQNKAIRINHKKIKGALVIAVSLLISDPVDFSWGCKIRCLWYWLKY